MKEEKNLQFPENTETLARQISLMTPFIEKKIHGMDVPGLDENDLRQESYIALFDAVRTYEDGKDTSFSTYAVSCINNRLTDTLRKAIAKKSEVLNRGEELDEQMEDTSPSPEEIISAREELSRVMDSINNILSGREKKTLLMWIEGYSVREIAKATGTSARSVTNSLSRARKKLKTEHIGE